MWMDNTGKTWTYSNNRGCAKGTLEPLWRAGRNAQSGDGYTHAGMGQDVGRSSIYFANFFTDDLDVFKGSQKPYLNPRADYIWIEDTGQYKDTANHLYHLHVWQNQGSGATKLKGRSYNIWRWYPLIPPTSIRLTCYTFSGWRPLL